MDAEFLDLIHTFQKASKRMNALNETMVSFKEVVTSLQDDLDQLVDMVELEGIVDLAKKTSQSLNGVTNCYDQMNESYERFIDIKSLNEQYVHGFSTMSDEIKALEQLVLDKLNDITLQTPVTQHAQIEQLAISHEQYLYEVARTGLNVSTREGVLLKTIDALEVSQFLILNNTLFLQAKNETSLYVVTGSEVDVVSTRIGTPFRMKDYDVYHILNHNLVKTNLLLKTENLIANHVTAFSIQGDWLIFEAAGELIRQKI